MANHKSAKKRNRQRVEITIRKKGNRAHVRQVVREARAACDSGADNAAELVKVASSMLDRAAQKNALPFPRASRLKSRLAIALHKSQQS